MFATLFVLCILLVFVYYVLTRENYRNLMCENQMFRISPYYSSDRINMNRMYNYPMELTPFETDYLYNKGKPPIAGSI